MLITSTDNQRVKEVVKLRDKKYRDITSKFIIEGDHLVSSAIKYNLVDTIFVLEGQTYDYDNIVFVTSLVMKKLSINKSIPKVLAIAYKQPPKTINGNVLLIDDIQDPGNLGTIIRSSLAFNIDTIILSPHSVDIYNEKVVSSSEGAIFDMNFKVLDLSEAIETLKKDRYIIYGTDVSKGEDARSQKRTKYVLLIGNEGAGVKEELLDKCDKLINIKTSDKTESLNVAIASSIILYELGRLQ